MKKMAEFSENRAQFLVRKSVFKISVRQHTLFLTFFQRFACNWPTRC